MKQNKKGFTLLELLICVVLISVVVVFLFKILHDVQNEEKNNGYVKSNQIQRNELIKNVGLILNKNKMCSYSQNVNSNSSSIEINFCDGGYLRIVTDYTIMSVYYTDADYNEKHFIDNLDLNNDEHVFIDPQFTTAKAEIGGEVFKIIRYKIYKRGQKSTSLDDIEFYIKDNTNE